MIVHNHPIVRIDVTQEDIVRGNPKDNWFCPIALAATRKVGIAVDVRGRELKCIARHGWQPLPELAKQFVEDFDEGRTVKPFSFWVWA